MNKKVIGIVGSDGKMGNLVCKALENDYKILKFTEENTLKLPLDKTKIDLIIDFANAKSSVFSAEFCKKNNISLLVASTGQTKNQLAKIKQCSKTIPLMICPNLSIGICLIKKMISSIIRNEDYDITIHEKHHREKKDSPSGTALMLKDFINQYTDKNISISSERGGKEIGTHEISFYFGNEIIKLSHQAFSREAFASGAEIATRFLLNQTEPKLYNFEDIFS